MTQSHKKFSTLASIKVSPHFTYAKHSSYRFFFLFFLFSMDSFTVSLSLPCVYFSSFQHFTVHPNIIVSPPFPSILTFLTPSFAPITSKISHHYQHFELTSPQKQTNTSRKYTPAPKESASTLIPSNSKQFSRHRTVYVTCLLPVKISHANCKTLRMIK